MHETFRVRDGMERFAVHCLVELANSELRFVKPPEETTFGWFDVEKEVKAFQMLCKRVKNLWINVHHTSI